MASTIIIEVLNRIGHVTERVRSQSGVLTIGRDYSNDLVVGDVHVSPRHARVYLDATGQMVVTDLKSHNGTYLSDRKHVISNEVVRSGGIIQVGKTRLRIISDEHPIADTVRLVKRHPMQRVWRSARGWVMLFCAIAISCLIEYIQLSKDLEVKIFIAGSITTAILALIWAGSWAFVGRVLKHKARFSYQLYATSSILLAEILLAEVAPILSYNLHSTLLGEILDYIFGCILVGMLLYFNIALATHLKKLTTMVTSGVVSAAVFATIAFMVYAGSSEYKTKNHYATTLVILDAHAVGFARCRHCGVISKFFLP